jgi:hypothetical protein
MLREPDGMASTVNGSAGGPSGLRCDFRPVTRGRTQSASAPIRRSFTAIPRSSRPSLRGHRLLPCGWPTVAICELRSDRPVSRPMLAKSWLSSQSCEKYVHSCSRQETSTSFADSNFGRASDRRPTTSIPAVPGGCSSGWACQAVRARRKVSCRCSAVANSHRRPGRFGRCQSPRRGADRGAR